MTYTKFERNQIPDGNESNTNGVIPFQFYPFHQLLLSPKSHIQLLLHCYLNLSLNLNYSVLRLHGNWILITQNLVKVGKTLLPKTPPSIQQCNKRTIQLKEKNLEWMEKETGASSMLNSVRMSN